MTVDIGLDFETYSGTDLTVHGLERYLADPTFTPLIASVSRNGVPTIRMDFVADFNKSCRELHYLINGANVVAHNAGFERGVLKHLNFEHVPASISDSAVSARVAGGNGHLFQASRQFLPQHKMEEGRDLMRLFSIPGKYQEEQGHMGFNPQVVHDNVGKWNLYGQYCDRDSECGLYLWSGLPLSDKEQEYAQITQRMNDTGWPIDRDVVEEMYARYLENQAEALHKFIAKYGMTDFNPASYPQKVKFCADRGIKAKSFDDKHVEKLLTTIRKKVSGMVFDDPKFMEYSQVIDMLELLQILGGSSLKKLKVMLDTMIDTGEGWRLKDQYVHCGAPQSLRTTGRSAQMQNLKRLDQDNIKNMLDLFEPDEEWNNDELALNLRQVFTASHEDGALLVADLASVESRGLAYYAGAQWKVAAFKQGLDMYKMMAAQMYTVHYDDVLKDQRQIGKVGELSCGYGAGPPAVQEFAAKMGTIFNEAEAAKLVNDWRTANPEILDLWDRLGDAIHRSLEYGDATVDLPFGHLTFQLEDSPQSLVDIFPKARSLYVSMWNEHTNQVYMTRVFHGVHEAGGNVRYFKPSKQKGGDVWKNWYIDPKTKQRRFHEIYGGKMAGILTQSFCREMFFEMLVKVEQWVVQHGNLDLIGQFHDEAVVDWWPAVGSIDRIPAELDLKVLLSRCDSFPDFPMAAEVKSDYRYIK